MAKELVSVLMSLYAKESPQNLADSLDSILAQTVQPDEIVMILDGPIPTPLQKVLDDYQQKSNLLRIIPLDKNMGLGHALSVGVEACRNELIARMDTDDLMVPDRLELQLSQFTSDSNLSICGSNIQEFDGETGKIIGSRIVPEKNEEIRQFSKRRSPFNHMTVMYRRQAVLDAGNYQPLQGFEDYYLWVRMLKRGERAYNIQKFLVKARTGTNMYARRGGWRYLINGIKGRYQIYRSGLGGLGDFLVVSSAHIVVSLMPVGMRARFYEKRLRT